MDPAVFNTTKLQQIQRTLLGLLGLCCLACAPSKNVELEAIPTFSSQGFLPVVATQLDQASAALAAKPRDADANGHYAMVLHSYDQFEPANAMYARAAALSRKPARWLYLQALTLAATSRTDDALEALRQARAFDADNPWIVSKHILMARMAGKQNEHTTAAHLIELLGAHEQLPELHYTLARIYAMDGQLESAVEHFEQAVTIAGPFGAAYYGMAMAQKRLGRTDQAAHSMLLWQHYKNRNASGSDPWLAKIDALNLSDIKLVQRAERLTTSGQLDRAVITLRQALERNPDSVAAHISIAGLYSNLKEFEQAEIHLSKARELEPQRAQLHYNVGLLRLHQQRFAEAEKAFRHVLSLDYQNANAFVQLALTQRLRGQIDNADVSLERALKYDPANRAARLQLAETQLERGHAARVIELLEGFYEPPDGGSAQMLLLLCKAHNQLQDPARVSPLAKRGIELAELWEQRILINQFKRQLQLAQGR